MERREGEELRFALSQRDKEEAIAEEDKPGKIRGEKEERQSDEDEKGIRNLGLGRIGG